MKKRILRLVLFTTLLAGVPLLSGCWDIKDINHRSLPIVMVSRKPIIFSRYCS